MTTTKALDKIEKVSELTLDKLGQICEEEGITVRTICQTLAEGMKSDIIKYTTEGEEHTRTADMPTRHKYMQSAMEVLKLVKKEVNTTNIINVESLNYNEDKLKRLEDSIEEERKLREELANNISHRGKTINVEARII